MLGIDDGEGAVIKIALILGATILLSVGLYIYFSPYHSCVRASYGSGAGLRCAYAVGSR